MRKDETNVTISLGREDLRMAVIALIKYLAMYPPNPDEQDRHEAICFNMGLDVLFQCLEVAVK